MRNEEKIAYIVPSDAAELAISEILKSEIESGLLDVMRIDVNDPEGEYQRICREGYTCIIARGGTYTDLKSAENIIPVLEERIRTADIVAGLAESGVHDSEAVYVVIHEKTADGAENLEAISGGKVRVLRYSNLADLKDLLENLPVSNVQILTSGYAASICQRSDLTFIELINRPHTIRETVRTARTFLSRMQSNAQQINTLNSIYNNIDEGIVIFSNEHIITEINDRAVSMINSSRSSLLNHLINEFVPELPSPRKDGQCSIDTPRTFTGKLGKSQISYTVYPFEFFRGETRCMMIMQDVTRIQTLEHNIRVQLSKKGLTAEHRFEDILTGEPVMQRAIDKARTIAGYEGSVLIYGESGTGKELFAQSIHNASSRSDGPFVAVNCSALTESLLESELFGYVGGSFTGARKEGKAGLFELAHSGTIFLDEINSTPLSLQTKILRVIESQQVMRVGSDYVIPLDVRILSASNGNLEKDIEEGSFRRDLYYRLNTFEITVPPVRDRNSDILLLFRYYAAKFADNPTTPDEVDLSPEFEKQLMEHVWLGNVREIRSTALRYNAFGGDNSNGDILKTTASSEALKMEPAETVKKKEPDESTDVPVTDVLAGDTISLSELSDTVEHLVIKAMENKGLSRTDIAKALGISRQALYKKMNKE